MKFVVRKAIANIGGVKKEIAVVRVAGVKIRERVKVLPKTGKPVRPTNPSDWFRPKSKN